MGVRNNLEEGTKVRLKSDEIATIICNSCFPPKEYLIDCNGTIRYASLSEIVLEISEDDLSLISSGDILTLLQYNKGNIVYKAIFSFRDFISYEEGFTACYFKTSFFTFIIDNKDSWHKSIEGENITHINRSIVTEEPTYIPVLRYSTNSEVDLFKKLLNENNSR